MTPQMNNPYRNITPEELHIAIRRAQLERNKAIREMFGAAWAWLRNAAARRHAGRDHHRALDAAANH